MLIIKIIILYFIQIRQSDDFPSTGRPTRLVIIIYLSVSRCSHDYRPQFLPDRLGRYLTPFASTVIAFSHAVASQFGLAIFFTTGCQLSCSPVTSRNGDNLHSDKCNLNSGHNVDRLSQNAEKATSKNSDNKSLYPHCLKMLTAVGAVRVVAVSTCRW